MLQIILSKVSHKFQKLADTSYFDLLLIISPSRFDISKLPKTPRTSVNEEARGRTAGTLTSTRVARMRASSTGVIRRFCVYAHSRLRMVAPAARRPTGVPRSCGSSWVYGPFADDT